MKKTISILLALFCIWQIAVAQELSKGDKPIEIAGMVVDETGELIPGATVHLKNTTKGVMTDDTGAFSIKATKGDILVITMLGYKSYEYLITEPKTDLRVKLEEDAKSLEAVVITGGGVKQRKITLTGAVSTVDVAELQTPATSITNMLGGRVPGIITRQNSGEPGKNQAEFWVRGIGTFGANKGALVMIDGREGNLNDLDPADIESFSVLKDASATAIYGVRGANGVVVVTTKRGTEGKVNIKVRVNFTLSKITRMPKYLRAYDYALLANEANVVRGDEPLYSDLELNLIKNQDDPDLYPDVDWRNEMIKPTSFQHTYYASADGGGSLVSYFLSLGTSFEASAYKLDKGNKYKPEVGFNKHTYRSNIDINLTRTTKVKFGVDGYISDRKAPGGGDTDELWRAQSKLTPMIFPTVYSDGKYPAMATGDASYSPYVLLNYTGTGKEEQTTSNVNLILEQDLSFITEGLRVEALLAHNHATYRYSKRFIKPDMYQAIGRDNRTGTLKYIQHQYKSEVAYSEIFNSSRRTNFEAKAFYNRTFKDHRFTSLLYYHMQNNTKHPNADSMDAIPYRYQGLSGQIGYGFKDTYNIDFICGYTGSENFEKGKQFGFFPSISAAWIPTQYNFVKELMPWLSHLKIRGSYGIVGNDKIEGTGRFPFLDIITQKYEGGWGGSESVWEERIGANNLKWEKDKKLDIGVDGALFNNKVTFEADVFRNHREGIFQQRQQIPSYVGLTSLPYGNVGEMKNWGFDGNIGYTQQVNKDMYFTVRANFTHAVNEVLEWEQVDPKYEYQAYKGWPVSVERGYIAEGLFRDDDDVKNSPIQTFGHYGPGDIKYKDVNGDGKINSDDAVPISYSDFPRLQYGFGGEFGYKNFTLGFLFKGVGKNDFYHVKEESGMGYVPFLDGSAGNVLAIVGDQKNRWTPSSYSGTKDTENPNAKFPKLSYGGNDNNKQLSTFWKGNSRYLRLQEVSISYKLVAPVLKNLGIRSMDLQLVGTDLYVWSPLKEWDPEMAVGNGRRYPIPRRFAFQVYINL